MDGQDTKRHQTTQCRVVFQNRKGQGRETHTASALTVAASSKYRLAKNKSCGTPFPVWCM